MIEAVRRKLRSWNFEGRYRQLEVSGAFREKRCHVAGSLRLCLMKNRDEELQMIWSFLRRESPTVLAQVLAGGGLPEEVVSSLIWKGFNPDFRDDKGWTPLHYAAHGLNRRATRALLNAGADPDAKDPKGNTPARLAASASRINEYSQETPIFRTMGAYTVERAKAYCLDVLHAHGAAFASDIVGGDTLLHTLAQSGRFAPETVPLIIQAGVIPEMLNAGRKRAIELIPEDSSARIWFFAKEGVSLSGVVHDPIPYAMVHGEARYFKAAGVDPFSILSEEDLPRYAMILAAEFETTRPLQNAHALGVDMLKVIDEQEDLASLASDLGCQETLPRLLEKFRREQVIRDIRSRTQERIDRARAARTEHALQEGLAAPGSDMEAKIESNEAPAKRSGKPGHDRSAPTSLLEYRREKLLDDIRRKEKARSVQEDTVQA